MKLVIAILLVIIAISLTGWTWLWWLLALPIVIFLAFVIGATIIHIIINICGFIQDKIEEFKQSIIEKSKQK